MESETTDNQPISPTKISEDDDKGTAAITEALLRNATGGDSAKVTLSSEEATRTAVSLASVVLQVQASTVEVPIIPVISQQGANVHHLTELPSVQEEVSTGFYPSDVYKSPKGGPKKSYDTSYKLRAIEFYKQGHSKLQTAKHFGVHPRRIREWITMEEVLKVSPTDRKRLTKRLLNKMNISESMITAIRQQKSSESVVGLPQSAELQQSSGEQAGWPYQPQEGQNPLSQLEQLADLTSQAVQLNVAHGSSVITDSSQASSEQEPQVQIAEVNVTTESSSATSPNKANVEYLKSLSKSQVQDLLDAMNLAKYKEAFMAEQVDGEIMSSFGDEELVELGVKSGVHRIRFLKLIQGRHSAEEILRNLKAQ